uniref:Uncharacterized protein n=1 Tax=Skeletonema marinoi TaxID=267567 RepID=A0A7S2Q4X3_9STRA
MKTSILLAGLCGSYQLSATLAFTQPSSTSIVSVQESRGATYLDARRNSQDDQDAPSLNNERRRVLFQCATSLLASTVPSAAQAASSEIFKPNPLTNTALEKIRIWNQDEVDNIKYGGELESGSAKPGAFEQYVDLLQPILGVKSDLDTINELISGTDKQLTTKEEYIAMFEQVNEILSHEIFVKIQFKKAFNAFADNIYYSDPDRANLYLGGGAVPQSTQTLAYLLRNDVLTTTEDMRAETTYLLKELNKNSAGETIVVGGDGLDLDEMRKFTKIGTEGMVKYLALVPPEELDAAMSKFNATR